MTGKYQGWESNPQNSGSKPDTYSIRLLWQAGRLGFEPRSTVLETAMLPLHHQPMVTGSLRVLALSFTRMAVPAEYAPLSFPPVWQAIKDLNLEQRSQSPVCCRYINRLNRLFHAAAIHNPARLLPSVLVGHPGIEPGTSDLSDLRANRLRQCPL